MKKLLLMFFILYSTNLIAAKDSKDDLQKGIDLTGKGFVGGEIGFGGITTFGVGVVGGYEYYFPRDWQFYKFRHGIRAIGGLNYGIDTYSTWWRNYTWHALSFQVGADYILDFTPTSDFNWGVFAGLNFGYHHLFYDKNVYGYNFSAFLFGAHAGGSLTMYKHHKLDVQLGWGLGILTLRYTYLF
ncbi:hypothetical protein [Helicobacter sp. MIT 14-3879]|uniref:hypothetical protein n=1 Tax=Helicobacter sp. MIT 14-3879 TaxID=2040649 RepID=UPI000E1F8E92|nr:hypothetical protein [Helicobacter sp. MIT 14-3879]RDU60380.1 hypothetical protein CQA44_10650 [Helicobacter sp. MIT 14-3879]